MSTHNICKEIILFITEPKEKFSLTTLEQHLDITLGPVIMQIYKLADALLITPYDVPYNEIYVLMSKYNNKNILQRNESVKPK